MDTLKEKNGLSQGSQGVCFASNTNSGAEPVLGSTTRFARTCSPSSVPSVTSAPVWQWCTVIFARVPSGTSVVCTTHRTFASSGTVSRGGLRGGQPRLWSGVTAGFDQRAKTVGAGGAAAAAGWGSATATGSPISTARLPHDVLLVMKQRIAHPAYVVPLELHVERVHHELALAH